MCIPKVGSLGVGVTFFVVDVDVGRALQRPGDFRHINWAALHT
jgi:hypothetical protein